MQSKLVEALPIVIGCFLLNAAVLVG